MFDPTIRWNLNHARALSNQLPNLRLAAAPFGGHPAHKRLYGRSRFELLIDQLCSDGNMSEWIHLDRRNQREEDEAYLDGMGAYLDPRAKQLLRE